MARHRNKSKLYKVSLNPREYHGGKKRYPTSIPKPIGDMIFEHGESWVAMDVVVTKNGVLVTPKSEVTSYLTCPFCLSMVQNPMRGKWLDCFCGAMYVIGGPVGGDGECRLVENYDPQSGMVVTGLSQSVLEMLNDSGLVSVVFERDC